MIRRSAFVAFTLVCLLALACGDDDGGEATATPYIAPSPLTIDEAIAELDAIIDQVRNPEADLVDASGIGEFELQTRIDDAVDGTAQVPGLEEVRQLLAGEDRILAGEFLHNNLVETLAIPFTDADTATISSDAMRTLDPRGNFSPLGQDFEVSATFRDAVVRGIGLWYLI